MKKKHSQKDETVYNSQYRAAYKANETDANKHMSFVNGAAGVLSLIIWALYLAGVFTIPEHFFLAVAIIFPVISLVMFTPLLLVRTSLVSRPGYKYFILFSLLIVIMTLNILVPKHSLLFWPFAILIANHYYKPTLGRIIYGVSILSMLICMYLGMFLGEFDENLFGGGVIKPDGSIGTVETIEERLELLRQLSANGNNRYIKVLVYYFFPRAMIITLFFMVSNLLNRRTYALLDMEIKIHDEQEKVRTELGVAKEIQINTLPDEAVESKDIEIIAELKAAKEVGGDLYDYLELDENHVAILIGDVSDKGVPAAMFMMRTITSFRDFATVSKTPSQILNEVNASINKGNQKSMFVTCFLAIIDKRDGKVIYANAGHNHPIVGSYGNYHYLKCRSGLLLGCFKKTILADEELTLQPGESITLYTDGVTEAKNAQGAMFGEERLLKVFNRKSYPSAVELHSAIKEEMAEFVQDASQSDDITLLTLRYFGNGNSALE